MFEKIREVVDQHYRQHKKSLEQCYPGLNKTIYLREVLSFIGSKTDENQIIDSSSEYKLKQFFELSGDGVPFEYISGMGHFYGRDFIVGPGVLIPRQETEIIIEEVLLIKNRFTSKIKVLDLCTGSGCLGLTLACQLRELVSDLYLTDISEEALEYATKNCAKFEFQLSSMTRLSVLKSDLLDSVDEKFELIVSNPPYIKRKEHLSRVHGQVTRFEPDMALFVDDDEYDKFFNRLFRGVSEVLLIGGLFFMEGHEDEIKFLANKWKASFPKDEVKVIQDLSSRDRFIRVIKEGLNG